MSMKNSNDTIWNRTSDLPVSSTVKCHLVTADVQMLIEVRRTAMLLHLTTRITTTLTPFRVTADSAAYAATPIYREPGVHAFQLYVLQ
jgi:hypothetical protein